MLFNSAFLSVNPPIQIATSPPKWSGQRRPQRPPLDLSKEPHGDDAGGLGDLPLIFFVTRWGNSPSTDIGGLHKFYIVIYIYII